MTAQTEIAVEALAAVIRGFSVDDTVARLARLAQSARTAQQNLAEDLDALDAAAQALLALMEQEDKRLLAETEDAVEAIRGALDGAEKKADDMNGAAEETAGALEALESAAGILATNLIEQLESRTDEPAETLAKQVDEAATALDQSLVALSRSIREIAAHELAGARKDIIERLGRHGRVGVLLEAQRLARLFEEWTGRVAGAADTLKKNTLVPAAAHPATAAESMMESCFTEHRDAFAALMPILASLDGLLSELETDLDRADELLTEQLPELPPAILGLEADLSFAVLTLTTCAAFLQASLRLR